MLKTKIVSGLEKPFLDDSIDNYEAISRISALRGERLTLEVLYTFIPDEDVLFRTGAVKDRFEVKLSGTLATHATLGQIKSVAVYKPRLKGVEDDGFLRTAPGIYPDLILPMTSDGAIRPEAYSLEALLIDIEIPRDDGSIVGENRLSVSFSSPKLGGKLLSTSEVNIEVINALIPEQELIYTQWFHYDSLAHYYNLPMWSERHWQIVENFARVAVKNGINMLLTPVFTPPLDTLRGGERLTTQLVGVEKRGNEYFFDYSLLDRFADMCNRIGIKYFEVSHLFTQGGAESSPKIMGYEDGEYKRLFGWETSSSDPEYRRFLTVFLKDLVGHMRLRGEDHRLTFHISDEPHEEHLERYGTAMQTVKDAVPGYRIMDAMSDFSFYSKGILKCPVVSTRNLKPFLDAGIKGLWTYYAGQAPSAGHLIAAPTCRTRSMGVKLYTHDIEGFLHWGYNFYNNCDSLYPINPFVEASGENWLPAGDAFSVYPARDGECHESLRLIGFKAGIDDLGALRLCESLVGREATLAAIEETLGYAVTYDTYIKTSGELLRLRRRINEIIKTAVS